MKASEIQPTSWRVGTSNVLTQVLMRKWQGIRDNVQRMEDTLLKLMENPQTTPEQLALGAKIYSNMTKQLHETALKIDEYIYHGKTPDKYEFHMLSCATRKTGSEDDCNCKDWTTEETQ